MANLAIMWRVRTGLASEDRVSAETIAISVSLNNVAKINLGALTFGSSLCKALSRARIPLPQFILVVVDERPILNLIATRVSHVRHHVVKATSLQAARQCLLVDVFEIVIVDTQLPDEDGLDLVQQIRRTSASRMIVISGRDKIAERVVGLEIGADDYILKPFHISGLAALVGVIARRLSETAPSPIRDRTSVRKFSGNEIDITTRRVKSFDGRELHLTSREFDVLWTLVDNAPTVLTREVIVKPAFGARRSFAGRPIDGLISRLRGKLFPDGSGHSQIKTIHGRGYQPMC